MQSIIIILVTISIAGAAPYNRAFYSSADCNEDSRFAYWYMPGSPYTCDFLPCFEIVPGQIYATENCTDTAVRYDAAEPKDGWSVVIQSKSATCDTTYIEYGAQPDMCFVFSTKPGNSFSYMLSGCLDDKIYLTMYPEANCSVKPSLIAANTTDECSLIDSANYKHLNCSMSIAPSASQPVAEPNADNGPNSSPQSNATPASNTTPQSSTSPIAAPTKKSSTGANVKLDRVTLKVAYLLLSLVILA